MVQEASPLYLQIADEIRRNIRESVYQVGDKLPTEAELSARFGVNRHTLRRAIEVLKNEGLIRVDRGRGTFVAASPISYAIGKRVRYNKALKAHGYEPSLKRLRLAEIPADEALSRRLGLEFGDTAVLYERLSLVDDAPISVSSSHFPGHLLPQLMEHCETYVSISQMLSQEYGYDHIRGSTRISACPAQARDARLLGLPLGAPVLITEAVNVNQHGQVIEYGVTRFRGDRVELIFENDLSQDCPSSIEGLDLLAAPL
jgi:GntR family transcriptional regulator, phosphonate transport system regulatory protein